MAEQKVISDKEMLLLQYSEFLDGDKHVMKEPKEGEVEETHLELVAEFLTHSEENGFTQYEVEARRADVPE